ncbi:MAG: ABC transporter ATP-binding protein [Acholeplasmatales bacterium]|nr:ABC transporter ATP-binding protein [Acholeplasmatales bacterium]
MLSFKKVKKKYSNFELNINNIVINEKDFVVVQGKSGSGKSTFLNIAGLLDKNFNGLYCFDGLDIKSINSFEKAKLRNEKIGFVFQSFNLIPNLSVKDNILLPYKYSSKKINLDYFDKVVKKIEIFHLLDKKIDELSGGEKQRVAFARAIILEPKYILADEPTGNLDSYNSDIIINELIAYNQEGHTVILITHNEKFYSIGNRNFILDGGRLYEKTN